MFKKIGKYVLKKVTKSAIGKAVKYGFWTVLLMFPGTAIGAVGVTGVAVGAGVVHSGIIEYGASSLICRNLDE